MYDLNVLVNEIQGNLSNMMQFMMLARELIIKRTNKLFKTSIVFKYDKGILECGWTRIGMRWDRLLLYFFYIWGGFWVGNTILGPALSLNGNKNFCLNPTPPPRLGGNFLPYLGWVPDKANYFAIPIQVFIFNH